MRKEGNIMKRVIIFLALFVFLSPAYAQELMREGLWELKTTISMPGSPHAIPPQTIKHCYTKEAVKKQNVPQNNNKDCKMTKHNVTGNKVTWEMVCTGQQKGTITGEMVYGKDTVQSRIKSTMNGRTTETEMQGKRLGNCPS